QRPRSGIMSSTLSEEVLQDLTERLSKSNQEFVKHYPGETGQRQPVHTVYGGAHLFKSDTAKRLGALARRSLDQFAPDFVSFGRAIEIPGFEQLPETFDNADDLVSLLETDPATLRRTRPAAWLAHTIYNRVNEKLRR